LKIAIVSPSIPPYELLDGLIGGAETYALNIAIEMSKLKHSITLITTSKNGASDYHFNDNLTIRYLPLNKLLTFDGQDAFSHKSIRLLMGGSYDLIHVHQIFTSFNIAAFIAGKMKKIPTFGTDHGGGPINYRVTPGIFARLPDYLIAVSNYSLNHLRRLAPKKKAYVAYGGVDTEVFNPMHSLDDLRRNMDLDGYKVVLCVGRLLSCKGFDIAVKAAYHLPKDTKLLLVGPTIDQYYYSYLKNLAKPLGNRVLFVGNVSPQDLPKYYNLCDVFVRSSVNDDCFGHHYNFPELLGLVKFEAMACGKPVVVSDVGGLPEQVINGQHGYIVKAGSDSQLANALNIILGDDSLRKKMGQQSLVFARTKFSWRKIAENTINFYKKSLIEY
jgi:glycosyltransferase involved in cell wall biosynthesis